MAACWLSAQTCSLVRFPFQSADQVARGPNYPETRRARSGTRSRCVAGSIPGRTVRNTEKVLSTGSVIGIRRSYCRAVGGRKRVCTDLLCGLGLCFARDRIKYGLGL